MFFIYVTLLFITYIFQKFRWNSFHSKRIMQTIYQYLIYLFCLMCIFRNIYFRIFQQIFVISFVTVTFHSFSFYYFAIFIIKIYSAFSSWNHLSAKAFSKIIFAIICYRKFFFHRSWKTFSCRCFPFHLSPPAIQLLQ